MKNKYIVGCAILYVVLVVGFLAYVNSKHNVEIEPVVKTTSDVKAKTKAKSRDIFDFIPRKTIIQVHTNDEFMAIVDELLDKVVEGELSSKDISFMDLDGDGDLDIQVRDGNGYVLYINVINKNK